MEAATPINPYRRGELMHKLLQYLPETDPQQRCSLIDAFLAENAAEMSIGQRNKIRDELLSLLKNEDFAMIFGSASKAEVPVMGQVGDRIISGQIDRLVVAEDKVMIIDFKTNRPAAQTAADVPTTYRRQLDAYAELVAKIYPYKKICKYILWTNTARLMPLDEDKNL